MLGAMGGPMGWRGSREGPHQLWPIPPSPVKEPGRPGGQPPAQGIRHLHGAGAGWQPVGRGQDLAQ